MKPTLRFSSFWFCWRRADAGLALAPLQASQAAPYQPDGPTSEPTFAPKAGQPFAPRQRVNLGGYFEAKKPPIPQAAPLAVDEATITGTVMTPIGIPYTNSAIVKLYNWDWTFTKPSPPISAVSSNSTSSPPVIITWWPMPG
jgi:hypothetical protein